MSPGFKVKHLCKGDRPRLLNRRQDEIFQTNPLMTALTSPNHALAHNGCSAAPFQDAADKSKENSVVSQPCFKGVSKSLKHF